MAKSKPKYFWKFYIQPFSKAATALENALPATIAEIREHPGARGNARSEVENIRIVADEIERVLDKLEKQNPSAGSAGVLKEVLA